ncbi:MAG: flagellar motor switch protein FliM [Planctomycetales bacterium]|nr:flagellar motor switch protein FliM [bacterium]UNM08429.1 MAG: flagellar motor switch protein FliM [Planctomycetales bacterium]
MADILSQEEIDALLGALSSGELKAEDAREEASEKNSKVKAYDFFRPSKFSKEQIRTIYMMHETYGRLWSSKLAGQLRNYVSISVSAVDQVTYQEFMQSIPNPTITCTFSLSPLEGQALFEFSPTIGFPIIDRLLGGQGQSNVQSREITEIEAHVLSNLIDEGMIYLKEAWSSMIDLKPELIDLESNPLFVQIVPPADMILLITLECRIGEMSGIMNIVYPYVVLEPILSLLSDRVLYAVGTRGASKESRNKTTQLLQNVGLKVSVELGTVKLSLRDLLALEPDDLVVLETTTEQDLVVKVGNIHKFNCIPGLDGKHYAAQVTESVSDADLLASNPFDGGI